LLPCSMRALLSANTGLYAVLVVTLRKPGKRPLVRASRTVKIAPNRPVASQHRPSAVCPKRPLCFVEILYTWRGPDLAYFDGWGPWQAFWNLHCSMEGPLWTLSDLLRRSKKQPFPTTTRAAVA